METTFQHVSEEKILNVYHLIMWFAWLPKLSMWLAAHQTYAGVGLI